LSSKSAFVRARSSMSAGGEPTQIEARKGGSAA
jgi:hypothetical protein